MSSIMIGTGQVTVNADLTAILADIEAHGPVVTSLLGACTDQSRGVVGLDWTIGQLGAHLAATADRYSRMAEGEAVIATSITDRQLAIDDGIDEHLDATAAEQAGVVERGIDRFLTALRGRSDDDFLPYYGIEAPPSLVAGMLLNELLVHGFDLARTHHRPLDLPDRAAYSALLASATLTSFVLTEWGRSCSMVLGWDAEGLEPILIVLDQGVVEVTHNADRRVDAWFAGSAANLLLVSYGRLGTIASLKTLRLRGRRPYLSLMIGRAFQAA